jgi:hypothetical protein
VSDELADGFNKEMVLLYKKALDECGYKASIFIHMIHDKGGVETAKSLLHVRGHPKGLTVLCEKGRLDLSMEALVLKSPWSTLFTKEDLDVARKRLEELEYEGISEE